MSILEAFDPCGREIISPTEVISREDGFPHTVIGCLNARFVRLAVKKYHFREISYIDISEQRSLFMRLNTTVYRWAAFIVRWEVLLP